MSEQEQGEDFHEDLADGTTPTTTETTTDSKPAVVLPPGYVEAGAQAATFTPPDCPAVGRLTFKEPLWDSYMEFQEAQGRNESNSLCLALFLKACVTHCTTGVIKPDMPLPLLRKFIGGLKFKAGNVLVVGAMAFRDQLLRAKASAGNG